MSQEQGIGEPPGDNDRRAAQESADELVRMGIEPGMFGLDPALPALPSPLPSSPRLQPAPHHQPGPPVGIPTVFAPPGTQSRPAAPPGLVSGQPGRPSGPMAPPVGSPRPIAAYQGVPGPRPGAGSTLNRPLTSAPSGPSLTTAHRAGVTPASGRPAVRARAALPAGWHRGLRAVALGLVQPGAAAAVDQARQLIGRIRTRQREPRVVAVIAAAGGVGTTTTAIGAAYVLDALRRDATAIVDARHGAASIGQRLAGRAAPTTHQLTSHSGRLRAVEPLQHNGSLGVVDGASQHDPPLGKLVGGLLDLLTARFAFTVVDIGTDLTAAGEVVLRRADQMVVVAAPGPDTVAHVKLALSRVYRTAPDRLATVVVALIRADGRQHRQIARRLHSELGLPGSRIIHVPFDPDLAADNQFQPGQLRAATREAYMRLCGCLARPEQPGPEPSGPEPSRPGSSGPGPHGRGPVRTGAVGPGQVGRADPRRHRPPVPQAITPPPGRQL